MSAQNYLQEGYDPSADPNVPAPVATAILQAIRQAKGVVAGTGISGTALVLWGPTAPDTINNPWFVNDLWWDTTEQVLKFYDTGAAGWDQLPTPVSSITADSIADGSLTIVKLAGAGGVAGQVMRLITPLPSIPPFFEFVNPINLIPNASVTPQLITLGAAGRFLYSDGTTNQWKLVDSAFLVGLINAGAIDIAKLKGNALPTPGTLLGGYYDGTNYVNSWLDSATLTDILNVMVQAQRLSLSLLSNAGATAGQVMTYNGATWIPASVPIPTALTTTVYDAPSALSVYTSGTTYWEFPHNLGVDYPKIRQGFIVCNSADASYAVGDEVQSEAVTRVVSSDFTQAISLVNVLATRNIRMVVGDTPGFLILPKTGGTRVVLTPSKWNLRVRLTN